MVPIAATNIDFRGASRLPDGKLPDGRLIGSVIAARSDVSASRQKVAAFFDRGFDRRPAKVLPNVQPAFYPPAPQVGIPQFKLLSWVAVPQTVAAGQFQCESRSLGSGDEASLRATARRLLPRAARIEVVAPCRNGDSAHAWISTRKTRTFEGVAQWWELTCRREMVAWGCDAPVFRQFVELQLQVDGQSRQIELSFDQGIALVHARSLTARALAVYADPSSRLPSCESGASSDPKLDALNQRDRLPAGWKSMEVSVSRDAAGHAVWLHDVSVEIGFPVTAGEVGAQGLCWDEVVVVT